jgi:hypothetical protein
MKNDTNNMSSNWEVINFRITGFLGPTGNIKNPDSWWEKVIGGVPETEVFVRAQNEKRFEGRFGDSWTVLSIQHPIRIDWRVGIREDEQITSDGLLSLGLISSVLDNLITKLANNWFELEDYPLIQRLAFGINLMQPVESRESGYKLLNSFLPSIDLDVENSSDFLYQINRTRFSKVVDGMLVNRLSKWGVKYASAGGISIVGNIIRQFEIKKKPIFASLELDINTPADYDSEFDRDKSKEIFKELLELSQEIAVKGDIA